VKFAAPSGLSIVPERFFVAGAKACPPAPLRTPLPAASTGDAQYVRSEVAADGIDITAAFRGRHCRVQVTGWYDANGNGNLDRGDMVGSTGALEVMDEGWFGDNSVRSPEVTLIPAS
jgi:hypothetical protein